VVVRSRKDQVVAISDREANWLDTVKMTLDDLPETEEAFVAEMLTEADWDKFFR